MATQSQLAFQPVPTPLSLPRRSPPPSDMIRQNPAAVLDGAPVCPPEDEGATLELKKESERQTWFQKKANTVLDIPNGYLKVSVLIVRWHEKIDEFKKGHDDEIARLQALFEDRLNYHCEIVKLRNCKDPQIYLNHAISKHIVEHDGPNNLLIIYYTGHGNGVDDERGRRLELSATQNWAERRGFHAPVAFWNEAEAPLRNLTEGDVLSILDCCFASSAALKSTNESTRTYQLLAASAGNLPTSGPGEKSFTTALITSMEELLDEHKDTSFPVTKLWEKINEKRTMSPALLWDRLQKHKRHVQLAPLEPGTISEERKKLFRSGEAGKASLVLRFSLKVDDLTKIQCETLAQQLPQACGNAGVPVRQIDWIKMEKNSNRPVSFSAVAAVVNSVKVWRRKSSVRRNTTDKDEETPTRKRSRTDETIPSGRSKRRSSDRVSRPSPPTPVSPSSMAAIGESSSSSHEA